MVDFNGSNAYKMRYEDGAAEKKKKQQPAVPAKKHASRSNKRADRLTRARYVCFLPVDLHFVCLSRFLPLLCDATQWRMS